MWSLDTFELSKRTGGWALTTLLRVLFNAYDLCGEMGLSDIRLEKFAREVECGYLPNPYHNKCHAADVVNSTHYILTTHLRATVHRQRKRLIQLQQQKEKREREKREREGEVGCEGESGEGGSKALVPREEAGLMRASGWDVDTRRRGLSTSILQKRTRHRRELSSQSADAKQVRNKSGFSFIRFFGGREGGLKSSPGDKGTDRKENGETGTKGLGSRVLSFTRRHRSTPVETMDGRSNEKIGVVSEHENDDDDNGRSSAISPCLSSTNGRTTDKSKSETNRGEGGKGDEERRGKDSESDLADEGTNKDQGRRKMTGSVVTSRATEESSTTKGDLKPRRPRHRHKRKRNGRYYQHSGNSGSGDGTGDGQGVGLVVGKDFKKARKRRHRQRRGRHHHHTSMGRRSGGRHDTQDNDDDNDDDDDDVWFGESEEKYDNEE